MDLRPVATISLFDPAALLPGVGTAFLAIISGAGGSALLELYWKPRRDRQKAAALLLAEILLNTDLALLQAHARVKTPRTIPADFAFSSLAWDATTDLLRELPPDLVKRILLLYRRYQHLNFCVNEYAKTMDELPSWSDPHQIAILKGHLNSTIDTFNTGLDTAIDTGKEILPQLLKLSGIKEEETDQPPRDYTRVVDEHLRGRAERIRALGAMDRPSEQPPSGPGESKTR